MPANRSGKFVSTTAFGPQVAKAIEDIRVARAAEALGVDLMGPARERPLSRTWRVRPRVQDGQEGREVAMVTVVEQATTAERELFATMAESIHAAGDGLPGVLRVSAVVRTRDAFLTDLWTAGSARDISALRWPPRRRVEFVLRAVRALGGLHRLGIVHGCLCPANILLDDALQPVLAEAGSVPVHALAGRGGSDAEIYSAFAAPEVVKGEAASVGSDVYSLGRILEDALKGDPPHAGLDEIVRRCTAGLAMARYPDTGELAKALEAIVELVPEADAAPRVTSIPAPARPSGRVRMQSPPPPRARDTRRPTASTAWEPPWALGIVGIVAVAAAVVASALVGGSSEGLRTVLTISLVAGVALATTLARPPASAGLVAGAAMQVVLALVCATSIAFLDPLSLTYRVAARQQLRGDRASRRAAVAEIMRLGRDFHGVSLADSDLSGMDMTHADLRGADLSRTNLTHARLTGADVTGAMLDGTLLAGANLQQVNLALASVGVATCDDQTRLPAGWLCQGGRVTRSP
jgi:hypothetical protein